MNRLRVYHFLNTENAVSDILFRRIKISRFSELNDPFELCGAAVIEEKYREALQEQTIELINKDWGLICFSKSWDNPVLWSHYADKHKGICLGFDIDNDPSKLHHVEYIEKPFLLTFDSIPPQINKAIADKLVRIKYAHWRYENEVRMFYPLSADSIITKQFISMSTSKWEKSI